MPLKTKKHKLRTSERKEKTQQNHETVSAQTTASTVSHFKADVSKTLILTAAILSIEILLFIAGNNNWLPILN